MTGQGTMTGKVFGGRYEIKDRIGSGGTTDPGNQGGDTGTTTPSAN